MTRRFILGTLFLAWAMPSYADSALDLAKRAAAVIGIGQNGNCGSCHAVNSKSTLLRWAGNANRVESCMESLRYATAKEQLDCITYAEENRPFEIEAYQLGFYAAALHLPEFQSLLLEAFGEDQSTILNAQIQNQVLMPLHNQPLSEAQFADLRAWYRAGLPNLNEILNIEPGPTTCEESVHPDFKTHLMNADQDNWSTRNHERGMRMFACTDRGCFDQKRNGKAIFPDVSTLPYQPSRSWKADAATHMHLLYETDKATSYWVRSSADGRFVGFGGPPSGVIDLQSRLVSEEPTRVIHVNANYDPSFFPDDSAFMFQGQETGICKMNLLKDARTKDVTFREDACSSDIEHTIPLYQSVGASLDGADYIAATGSFHSDIGEGRDPGPGDRFVGHRDSEESQLNLYPILFTGQKWSRRDPQVFKTPWEIDWSMSPSNRLLLGRRLGGLNGETRHLGYNVYNLKRPSAADPFVKTQMAQICLDGSKGNFSFDDRFLVTYAYIKADQYKLLGFESPDDPVFKTTLDAGSANIFLYDFWTQKTTALTHMGPDQYAQFPHFRSDGWIYFEVFDSAQKKRLILASDAAVLAKTLQPTE